MKDIKKGQTPKVNLNPDKSSRPSQFNAALKGITDSPELLY